MSEAPLNRDEQIAFIKNGSARRAAAIDRWLNSETYRAAQNPEIKGLRALQGVTYVSVSDKNGIMDEALIKELGDQADLKQHKENKTNE